MLCADGQPSQLDFIPFINLDDVAETSAPEQRSTSAGHDHRQPTAELLQRRDVEMVPVEVRDEYAVDALAEVVKDGHEPA